MLTFAVIGYGGIGRMHTNNLLALPGVRVAHIVDPRPDAFSGDTGLNLGTAAGADLSGIACHAELERALADPAVDVAMICTPTKTHRALVEQALRAGKHVICEKPLSLDPADVRAMVATARETGKRFFGAFCIRFWPEYVYLTAAVRDRRYGALLSLVLKRISPPPTWTADNWMMRGELSGGGMGDLHIHDLDYAVFLLGRPKHVYAAGTTFRSGEPDIVYTTLRYDGPSVLAHGSFANAGYFDMAFRAYFERGTLEYSIRSNPALVFRSHDGQPDQPIETAAESGHAAELRIFVDAIAHNKPLADLSDESMILSAETYAAARKSIDTGLPVAV